MAEPRALLETFVLQEFAGLHGSAKTVPGWLSLLVELDRIFDRCTVLFSLALSVSVQSRLETPNQVKVM